MHSYLSWVLSVFHQIIKYFTDTDHQDRGHLGIGLLSYLYISLVYFRDFSVPPHGEIQYVSVVANEQGDTSLVLMARNDQHASSSAPRASLRL
jgi:hypothetical protein